MYIDPNSGGMLFQILVVIFGVLSGAVLMFSSRIKMGIAKLRRTLRKKNEENKTSEKQSESDQ